jgi:cytochrome c oxidase cbb3-type subunit 3
MKNLFAILLILLLPVSGHSAPQGEKLYSQNCAACHGENGKGGVGVPLALASFLDNVSDHYLFTTIRQGRPGRIMPSFQEMSDAQVDAIVSYIRGWSKNKAPVYPTDSISGNPANGKKLYAQHCAGCHGADASGGSGTGVTFSRPRDLPIIAPSLANPGFLASASDAMIKHTLQNGRQGTPMNSFASQGMSEQQMDDIVAYIRSLQGLSSAHKKAEKLPAYFKYESSEPIEATLESLKAAAVGANFRIIREQHFEQGYVEKGKEDSKKIILYFCNFNMLNKALAIDPRVGLFLPCRVTLIEQDGKVSMITVNPSAMSKKFNNAELSKICEQMSAMYRDILEEAAL